MAPKLSRDKLELIDDLLYKSKKPKQALKELEKLLKKVPGSAQLQVLKAQSLLECHRHDESRAICKAIARQAEIVNDLQLINDLHFLRFRHQKLFSQDQLSSEPDIVHLWQTAAKVQKSRTEVLLQWYGVAASCDHWEDAQLAMAGLRKEDPSELNYLFYYIAITHMLAELQRSSDSTRSKLNSTLAYRLLQATFKQKLSKQGKAAGNSTLTSQSLDLLIQIYMAQHCHEELLSLLDDPKLLEIAEIGINGWHVLRIRFQLLEDQRQWERLRSLALATIWPAKARKSDGVPNIASVECSNHDLLVFKALVRSSRELNDSEKLKETTQLLMGFHSQKVPFFSKRNASIALMHLLIDLYGDRGIIKKLEVINLEMESLFSACLRHYQLFGHHICCFDDIKKPISELSIVERKSYMQEVKVLCEKKSFSLMHEGDKRDWLVMEINYLKLEFLLRISQPHFTATNLGQLDAFLDSSFSVLRLSRSQKDCQKRDLYHLITLALLRRLSLVTNEIHHKNFLFMQLACLLESSHKYESNDRQILLLLACLYKSLGFGSTFMYTYQKLRIKDILYEPLAHILYTRISLSHPFPVSLFEFAITDENARDAHLAAVRIINKSASAIDTVNRLISDTYKTPIYNRLSEYVELKRKISGSRTKQIVVIEKRRMSRFRDKMCDENDLHETDTWLRHSNDERDLSCLPFNGQADNLAVEKLIHDGPPPNEYWIAMMMLWDETYSCLLGEPTFRTTDLKFAEKVVKNQKKPPDLTDSEWEMSRGWLLLHTYVKVQTPCEEKAGVASMTQLLTSIIDFAEVRSEKVHSQDYSGGQFPDSAVLQKIYLTLEYLRACSKIGQFHQLLPKPSGSVKNDIPTKDQVNVKMKDVQSQVDKLRLFISNWRNMLAKRSISVLAEQMQSGTYSDHLKELIGPELSESCAKSFLGSALDALDGLLRAARL